MEEMKREVMNDEYWSLKIKIIEEECLDRARLGLGFLNGRLEMYQIREIDRDKILWRDRDVYVNFIIRFYNIEVKESIELNHLRSRINGILCRIFRFEE